MNQSEINQQCFIELRLIHTLLKYGAQNKQQKLMVFEKEAKTCFETDKKLQRLQSRVLIKKSDIAYVTTRGSGTNKDYVSVFMDDGRELFSDFKLKNFLYILFDAVQVNKSNIVPVEKVAATNEWYYVYVICGGKTIPFEVMPDYRDMVKHSITMISTLPKTHEQRLPE